MCGIFGWALSERYARHELSPLADRLIAALRHRGPNDAGFAAFDTSGSCFTESGREPDAAKALLLGQTRLSIIDLSPAGRQPMLSSDGRYALVFNGEIYNFIELRRELEAAGDRFSSNSDTEVLLRWLIRHGKPGLSKLTGMFAFAFYDAKEGRLLCARDFFGIKPFYYCDGEAGFAFASEIPALLEFPGVSRSVSPQAAYSYLCFGQYDFGAESFLAGVKQLPPGHCLELRVPFGASSEAKPRPELYWRPDLGVRSSLGFKEAAARVRELFLSNVRLHLRSDVPWGVALSGGIDSSAVACAVRHLEPDAEIRAFSFVATGSEVSEESWMRKAIAHARLTPSMVEASPSELVRDIDKMILNLGEPFGSTSIYAQRRVFQLARESGVVVTLDGQGADELFAGYQGYPGPRIASLLLHGDPLGAARFFSATTNWPDRPKAETLRRVLREFTPESLVAAGLRLAGRNPEPAWLDVAALKDSFVRFGLLDERSALYPSRDRVRQTLAYQLTWNGLPQLLRHGDRNSMAFSIESRVPFLTKDMAELALSLPEEFLVDMGGRTKAVFREAMRGIVPDEILDRRDKIGFATPERQWMESLGSWIDETLAQAKDIPFVKLPEARREWTAIREGKASFDWRVWRWVNYVKWVELFKIVH